MSEPVKTGENRDTIEMCCEYKRYLMRRLSKERQFSPMAQVYDAAIRHLDERTGRIFKAEQERIKNETG